MVRISHLALRWLGWALAVLCIVTGLVVLGFRYAVLPTIDHYRPAIEAHLSKTLNGQVTVGSLDAQWRHFNPRISLAAVSLRDQDGRKVLDIPRASVVLSWRSLLTLTPQFVSVYARDIDITVRRDTQNNFWVLGHTVDITDPARNDSRFTDLLAQWLLSQPQVMLRDSTVRWLDDARGSPPLVLDDVTFKVRNHAHNHQFSLAARPAFSPSSGFDFRGYLKRTTSNTQSVTPDQFTGQLYLAADHINVTQWRQWLDWPDYLDSGPSSTQLWLDVRDGAAASVTADVRMHDASWRVSPDKRVQVGSARVFAKSSWQALQDWYLSPDPDQGPSLDSVNVRAQAQDLAVHLDDLYDAPVLVDALSGQATLQQTPAGPVVHAERALLENNDAQLITTLSWAPDNTGGAGVIDATANIHYVALPAVSRYMPKTLDADVRLWLEKALRSGYVNNGRLTLKGDLAQFPFDEPDTAGEFRLSGDYYQATVDYAPATETQQAWPRLFNMQGHVELDGAALRVHADTANIAPISDSVTLSDVDAHITDLKHEPLLSVQGHSQGPAAVYFEFLNHSPLAEILDHSFQHAQAKGVWSMPLGLSIPLSSDEDTTVSGQIHMQDAQLRLEPDVPWLTNMTGAIDFTQNRAGVIELTANLLDGPLKISGSLGDGQPGLTFQGHVGATALADWIALPGMARFSGSASYAASLTGIAQDNAQPQLVVSTDLHGFSMDFPEPLAKSAEQVWPLELRWSHTEDDGVRVLDVSLAKTMAARFVHRPSHGSTAYFQAGTLSVAGNPGWPLQGMSVDIRHPVFNGDLWDRITREFMISELSADTTPTSVFPPVTLFKVKADTGRLFGTDLQNLNYTVQNTNDDQWEADIRSDQTTGELSWRQLDSEVIGPVQAVFTRLAIGTSAADRLSGSNEMDDDGTADGDAVSDDVTIPAINLLTDELSVYGRNMGKLSLVGVSEDRGNRWRLEQFALSSPSAYLEGSGVLHLRGPERGLALDAAVDVSDLGDYFNQIGVKDVINGGKGRVTVSLQWHNLPWQLDTMQLDGRIGFDLEKGRLNTRNSWSARLLEVISLQSVQRLAKLDFNPFGAMKDGFPYDSLRGSLRFKDGHIQTEGYRIAGPVGTIDVGGQVDLGAGTLDLDAMVVPNLDISGAAIAAGIVINPLVGVGTLLTQWLLKAPLSKAMAVHYQIRGDWDDPNIAEVEQPNGKDTLPAQ